MRVVFLGPPGAGKGTQAERFAALRSVPHISTGEILRQAVAEGTDLGRRARPLMDSGALVPDDLMAGVVSARLSRADCAKGFLLDGFPRTVPQAELLDGEGVDLDHVVQIDVPTEEVVRRLMDRKRDDDTPETVRNRIAIYEGQTEPLVAHYAARALLRRVDGMGTVDEVFARIAAAVDGVVR